ncbi:hypothetical protein [Longispora albida]|uniref:hypothetical protein n=1 Tax=Longispora albida TaxID=203523 RepID=UPI0003A6A9F0|nr:hypothetical protein [Longispora albida]
MGSGVGEADVLADGVGVGAVVALPVGLGFGLVLVLALLLGVGWPDGVVLSAPAGVWPTWMNAARAAAVSPAKTAGRVCFFKSVLPRERPKERSHQCLQ